MPFVKGVVLAGVVVAALLVAGVLMVPLLEHYALAGVLLTAALLYARVLHAARAQAPTRLTIDPGDRLHAHSGRRASPSRPWPPRSLDGLVVGLVIGVLVSGVSHALFPDPPRPARRGADRKRSDPRDGALDGTAGHRGRHAGLRAGADQSRPSTSPAIMKTVALGQQAGATSARSAGQELVGLHADGRG